MSLPFFSAISARSRATCIGLIAVVLWSSVVGLIRSVSEHLGVTGGAALIYSLAAVFLLLSIGPTKVHAMPRRYLLWGSLLFVVYELCLALSIGYANTRRQAIEVGMVNYLWPALTMAFAIVFNQQKTTWLIVPGFALAMSGVCWVLGGDEGLHWPSVMANVQDNPLSYGLALAGALIWAAYCTVTVRLAKGHNGITLFVALTAATLWAKYLVLGDATTMVFSWSALLYLVFAAAAMGFGYAAWNVGILHGNVTVLAGASYFIPVFSAALAALVLQTPLPVSFWQGAAMVCVGSILCWLATRSKPRQRAAANS